MQILRFRVAGTPRYGVREGAVAVEYSGTPWSVFRRGRRRYPLRQCVLLAPVLPSKIVAGGPHYRAHAPARPPPPPPPPAARGGAPAAPFVPPPQSARVEHEAELAVVMRRRCHDVPAARGREYGPRHTCPHAGPPPP